MGPQISKSCCVPKEHNIDYEDDNGDEGIDELRIHNLPNEILLNIFQHLDLLEKMRSNEAFEGHKNVQGCLWKISKLEVKAVAENDTLDYFNRPVYFSDLLTILQKSGQDLKTLSFDLGLCASEKYQVVVHDVGKLLGSWDPDSFLQYAIENCKNLRMLQLRLARPVKINFCKLIEVNKKLKCVSFHVESMIACEYMHLSEALERFSKLKKNLSIFHVTQQGEADFPEKLYEKFNVEKHHAVFLLNESRSFIQKLVPHNLSTLLVKRPWSDNISWTVFDMKSIAQLKHLVEIKFDEIDTLTTNEVMSEILKGCTKLEKISLSNLNFVSAECMNTIMTLSASLKTVELNEVEIQSLLLNSAISKVESLSIKSCYFFRDGGIRDIGCFPYLKKLNLEEGESRSHLRQYSNDNLLLISRQCRELEEVTVNVQTTELTNGMAFFANLPNLRSFNISASNISKIYPKKNIFLVLPISNLRSLKIFNCKKLSEDSMIQAVSHMPHLETFYFFEAFNTTMTNKVIKKLIKYCKKLHTLDLTGCRAVTASGIMALKNCHNLMNLNLMYLNIEPFSISDLVQPNLKNLRFRYLPHLPEDFVKKSITENMRKFMFSLMYNDNTLI